ncbi:MAG: lipase maturation factor family protein [Chthoniobacterales bacterium]|nr:lipase maturation factor family protein [Chthoniobacterales bacterium]
MNVPVMSSAPHCTVANPPSKPLMIFDGDCHFCRRWIERWREITVDRVEYASSQEVGQRFPEIAQSEFANAVQLVEPNGEVFRGAAAVFRSLGKASGRRWMAAAYDRLPGVATVAEAAYAVIARNRQLASTATRWLWGDDVRRPTYYHARRWFLRALGLVYLIAFISVWVQVDGLMGEHGLTPAGEMLSLSREISTDGTARLWFQQPTLCWISSSGAMLHALCAAGAVAAAVLMFGLLPVPALLVCFGCYLSLIVPGEVFFSYQWDILLLETGFVALFVAPLQWRMVADRDAAVSRIGWFLVTFLLFKLMFMSGVVKLTSGDETWWNSTALEYHYWTQPLPTVFAWFADKNPEWLKKAAVAATLLIETVVPFFIWAPRRLRHSAAVVMILLQVGIAFTGDYGFFNLLTAVLCLLLFDDTLWRRRHPAITQQRAAPMLIPAVALAVTLPLNLWLISTAFGRPPTWAKPIFSLYSLVEPFRIANGYGLFRVMTKERPEIVFEGTANGVNWRSYEFRWKPGDPMRPPQWNAPHQPRLDWSMWFAALGSRRDRIVVERLASALLRNEPAVLALLGTNPFVETPPASVRARIFDYRFTTSEERSRSGAWWKRDEGVELLPPVGLQDFE